MKERKQRALKGKIIKEYPKKKKGLKPIERPKYKQLIFA